MPLAATTRIPTLLSVVLAGLLTLAGPTAAPGAATSRQQQPNGSDSPTVIDFEDYPANRVGTPAADGITDFYRRSGLVFVRPVTALVYNDKSVPADPGFPRSGSTVITTCYGAEFCSNNIEMQLLSAHRRVQLWVGYDGPLRTAATLLLIGFDDERRPVARDVISMGPSDVRLPVATPLEISDPEGRINSVQLVWADQSAFLSRLSVDDIELTPFVATSSVEFESELVRLDADDGQVEQQVRLLNTGDVEVEVAAIDLEVEDGTDPSFRFAVDGSACITILDRGSSCEVTVSFGAEENGTRLARVIARDSAGAILALTTLEATVTAVVTGTTNQPESTDGTGSTTGDPVDTTTETEATDGTATENTENTENTAGTGGGGNGQPDRAAVIEAPVAAVLGVLVVLVMVGLTITARRIGRRTRRPTRDRRPRRPQPRPEITAQSGDASHEVMGDDGPLVTIRAVIGPGRTDVLER